MKLKKLFTIPALVISAALYAKYKDRKKNKKTEESPDKCEDTSKEEKKE